jgi:hypothetical protein
MIDRGITMQDLGEKQVNNTNRIKQTSAPDMIDMAAGICDLGAIKLIGGGTLKPAQNADNPAMHDLLLTKVDSIYHLYGDNRRIVQAITDMSFKPIRLMPFSYVPFSVLHPV